MLNFPRIIILLSTLLALILVSCSHSRKDKTSEAGDHVFRVEHRVGDDYTHIHEGDTISYLAYPFSVGDIDDRDLSNTEAILIGRSLRKAKKVSCNALAVLRIKEYGGELNICVMTPSDPAMMLAELNNFSDFIIRHKGIKNIIEQWYLNRCGIGCSEYLSWEDESYIEQISES